MFPHMSNHHDNNFLKIINKNNILIASIILLIDAIGYLNRNYCRKLFKREFIEN